MQIHKNTVESKNAYKNIHIIIQHTNEALYTYVYIEERRQTKSKEENFGKTLREVFIEENLVQELYAERTFCFLSVSGGKTLILCFSCSSVSMSNIQEKLNCG